jgi:hypothetical protein
MEVEEIFTGEGSVYKVNINFPTNQIFFNIFFYLFPFEKKETGS